MKMLRLVVKLSIVAAILWVVRDRVDFSQFRSVLNNPVLLASIPLCWLLNQTLTTLRLHALLTLLGRSSRLEDVFRANMSSLFVGTLMPGVIGADLIKFFYLRRNDPDISKLELAVVLGLDRILGLVAVLFWCSVFSFFVWRTSSHSPSGGMSALTYLPVVLFLTLVVALVGFDVLITLVSRLKLPEKVIGLIEAYKRLRRFGAGRSLVPVFAYNLLAVLVLLIGLVFVGASLHLEKSGTAEIAFQFFLIPLALISSMLPLTPMGIGVAQITLASAYEMFGLNASVGVSVSTLSQLGLLVVAVLVGGVAFVFGKKGSLRPSQ
jgi:uncharacterized protein (TIRG00374 family)